MTVEFEEDHEVIYLEPNCEQAIDRDVGRLWCQDDVWGVCGCDECGRKSTKYIRYDLFEAERAKVKELEEQIAVMREALENVDKQKDCLSFNCANAVIKALSMTQ